LVVLRQEYCRGLINAAPDTPRKPTLLIVPIRISLTLIPGRKLLIKADPPGVCKYHPVLLKHFSEKRFLTLWFVPQAVFELVGALAIFFPKISPIDAFYDKSALRVKPRS
jgi:hypothetical protein